MTNNDARMPAQEQPPPHQVEAAETPPSIAAVAFFFEQCQAQLERQMQDVDAMDAKMIAVATAGTLHTSPRHGLHIAAVMVAEKTPFWRGWSTSVPSGRRQCSARPRRY